MRENPDDVVRAASGDLLQVELWHAALADAGIESRVVGEDLSGVLGMIPSASVELWVHRQDLPAVAAILREKEAEAAARRAEGDGDETGSG